MISAPKGVKEGRKLARNCLDFPGDGVKKHFTFLLTSFMEAPVFNPMQHVMKPRDLKWGLRPSPDCTGQIHSSVSCGSKVRFESEGRF